MYVCRTVINFYSLTEQTKYDTSAYKYKHLCRYTYKYTYKYTCYMRIYVYSISRTHIKLIFCSCRRIVGDPSMKLLAQINAAQLPTSEPGRARQLIV